ncbi:MAG TPA: efflux RND transporter periplasmic adaptor subunit [Thermoanaerobaculia bacterium]|nr:efflux RND transporter periplasmic adaptor subunit [Thermoanaerobaculia bacterium]
MASDKATLDGLRINRSAAPEGGRGRLAWILGALLLLLISAGVFAWLRLPRSIEVRVAAVRERPGTAAGTVLNASGYVTARRQATVSSKVTGKVTEVLVEEGMVVREGQVLARLDDSILRKELSLAAARLAAQRRATDETRVRLHEAEVNLRRARSLREQGVAPQSDLDATEAQVGSLKARLDLGREEVSVSEQQLALNRQYLEDTVIRAPFSGVAVSKDAQPGEMISPVSAGGGFTRTGICTIVDMSSLEVEVDVNESYIQRVRPGQKAIATLDAYPDWQIPARVIMPVPTADRQKATVRVRLAFDQLDPRILPDMGVKVAFLDEEGAAGERPKAALVVPRRALRKDGGSDVVFVVKGEEVERRAVGVGPAPGDEAVITSGLSAGERVVVEAPTELVDGAKVAVLDK